MAVAFMAARRANSSEYGWFIKEMMGAHRFASQLELSEAVKKAGYPISQPALSKVISGKTEPSRKLHRALVVAMELTPEETREFNDIFALSDVNVLLTEENREGMRQIDQEARRAAENDANLESNDRTVDRDK